MPKTKKYVEVFPIGNAKRQIRSYLTTEVVELPDMDYYRRRTPKEKPELGKPIFVWVGELDLPRFSVLGVECEDSIGLLADDRFINFGEISSWAYAIIPTEEQK